jgi:hypothetical protein
MPNLPIFNQIIFGSESFVGTDPAAGDPQLWYVPTHYIVELVFFQLTFATSAAVANRFVNAAIQLDPLTSYTVNDSVAQPAGLSRRFAFVADGIFSHTAAPPGNIVLPFPRPIFLKGGDNILIWATPMDAADQFTSLRVTCKTWVTP